MSALPALADLLKEKERLLKALKEIELEIIPFQSSCKHGRIQPGDHESLVVTFKGVCPDCQKVLLSEDIVKLLKGQYPLR